MTYNLHFICHRNKQGEAWVKLSATEFESGDWHGISAKVANDAVGGRIYLHEHQSDAAWHGGTITGWRNHPTEKTRKIFSYVVDGNFRVKCRAGWNRESAVVVST